MSTSGWPGLVSDDATPGRVSPENQFENEGWIQSHRSLIAAYSINLPVAPQRLEDAVCEEISARFARCEG
jgi:hypothetical protein